MMNRPDTLTATIRIAAAPADVFPYLVDPDLLVRWIGAWAELNPVPGGIFALEFEGTPVRGTYVSVEPPDRVVFTWGVPGSIALPAGSSTVEILLKADGDETVVELFHHDLPADQRPQHEVGWTACLAKLRQVADQSPGAPHRGRDAALPADAGGGRIPENEEDRMGRSTR